ncbi:hypothetical protein [Microcoleus sp. OTE_8_concoct_300]
MSINLDQPDFRRLTSIVQNLPDFANVRGVAYPKTSPQLSLPAVK